MSNTRDKLEEAQRFLQRMEDTQSDRIAFRDNLSAFLSAAQSVIYIMQSEFKSKQRPAFKTWFQTKVESDKEITFIETVRGEAIHSEPVKPYRNTNITTSVTIGVCVPASKNPKSSKIRLPKMNFKSKQKPTGSEPKLEQQWYFNGRNDKDVVALCTEHLTKLESLVAYCEAQFMASSKR